MGSSQGTPPAFEGAGGKELPADDGRSRRYVAV